jgi:hypothetical protein
MSEFLFTGVQREFPALIDYFLDGQWVTAKFSDSGKTVATLRFPAHWDRDQVVEFLKLKLARDTANGKTLH